jgi:hypothetical protein
VLCQQGAQIPLLQQTILDLPAGDSEITVVRVAIHKVWVPAIDAERTRSTAKAAASSAVLRGMYGDINRVWMAGVAEALARRKGLESTDARSKAMARVTLAIFGGAIETWVAGKCLGNLPDVIDREFAMVESLFAEAAKMSG